MAHLGNTIVNGALRVIGGEYVDTINGVTVGSSPKFTDTTYNVVSSSANGLAPKVTDTSKFLKGDGTWATPTDTNNAVTQTATSTSADYEVLFSVTADNTTRTEGARKNSNLKFNPSTGNLQATQLNGVAIGSSPKFTDNDTKNTAGSTDTSSKIFLVGATSQAANPQTYSHDTAYVGTDGCLYSGGTKVLTAHQDISGKVNKSGDTMTGDLIFNKTGATDLTQVQMKCGTNDYGRIAAGATAANAGYLEIATADDGTEPIYVRQYSGTFTTKGNEAILLDGSGNTSFPKKLSAKIFQELITGSGTAAQDKGSGVSPRYFPAKWTFNTGCTATDGDIITIKIPCAGHDYGVFVSIDNGTNYYPVRMDYGTGRLSTHYGNGQYITLIYTPNATVNNVYAVAGADARSNITRCWTVLNNYDTNTDVRPSAYCDTAAATAAKVASCSNYNLLANSYIHVIIVNANSSKTAITLNINGKGAKPIYINGAASSTSNYTLPAGSYLVYYNGTNYYFRTDGKITGAGIVDIGGNTSKFLRGDGTWQTPTNTTYTAGTGLSLSGTQFNVSTVPIANGGTGATTRLNAVKALTNENVSTSANYFLTITSSWGKAGYTSVGDAKTVLGLKSAAYTESTAYAAASHTHGNIQNGGTLQTNDITIASGDKIVVTDSSDSSKLARTSISFDGSTATQCLTKKGTWATFGTSNLAIGTTASTAAAGNHTHGLSIAADSGTSSISLAANTKYKLTAGGSTYIFTTPKDNNTTYSAGTGLSLSGTKFSTSVPRVSESVDTLPGTNSFRIVENSNDSYRYMFTMQGSDANDAVQLRLGVLENEIGYRRKHSGTWAPWRQVLPFYSSSVSAAINATTCTINDSRITTTSILEPFSSNSSGTIIAITKMVASAGKVVLTFPALTEATSFVVRITNETL